MNRQNRWDRRTFLQWSMFVGAVPLVGLSPRVVRAQSPPETAAIRVARTTSICQAPQYVVDALFEAERFTDVQFVGDPAYADRTLISGQAQIGMLFLGPLLLRLDEGAPLLLLSGGHIGCIEVLAHPPIRAVRDLKGKRVTVTGLGTAGHVFLATVMAYVGLDPGRDVTFVEHPPREAMRLFEERKVDAYVATPPFAQELRAKKIGHVVVNSSVDRPWSQYFCCFIVGNHEFVRKNPVATKRALRAILKGVSICALEPERAARSLVDKGLTPHYDHALQTMKDVPYGRWRDYDPQDTVRFYAVRLHELGMLKSTPQKLLAQGAEWRFLNELRKELKG